MRSTANRDEFTPDKQVAVLLLSIDRDLAAAVLRHLSDDHLDMVTRAMRALQELAVDTGTVDSVYRDLTKRMRSGGMALGDVGMQMETLLVEAFGTERGIDVSTRANTEILARRPFAMFESLSAEDLCGLLAEEHPQIAAVFLAHLERAKAGQVIAHLPEDQKSDMIRRVASLDRTPPEVVKRVLDVMRKKVKDLGLTALRSEPQAWVKAAAEILNNVGGGEKTILEQIAETNEAIATQIRDEMFTFDDLGTLDKRSTQKILGQIDTRMLALAMKATPLPVEENIFNNLSQRAGVMLREERDTLGPTPLSEVLEAQHTIMEVVRDMMDRGEILAASRGEEMV